ncbi:MAG: phytoene desaturase family protein [Bryobacteraceae bacterium]
MKAVVIGGGLGGLATALRLNAGGWQVTVCEAGPSFGGKMNRWRQDGYTFDTGPSLVTMPHVFARLYEAIGERMEEHLSLVRVDPHADYRFPCGARVICPDRVEAWRSAIRQIEPRDLEGFDKLRALGRNLYELSARTFFRRSPAARPSLSEIAALRYLPIRRGWGNYARTVESLFRSPYLRRIYNRYPTYVGSSPYLCPATLLVIPFIEHEFGAWYVRGGLYAVVESLLELARSRNVECLPSARVVAIERDGERASAVRLENGTRLAADAVVMNGDADTAPQLLGEPRASDPGSRSLSGVVLLLGVRERPAGLGHHTVVFSSGYRAEFDDLFLRREFPQDPTVYISAPAASDPSVASPGGDALFVMANAPGNGREWTTDRVDAACAAIRAKLAPVGIDAGAAEVQDVWHPGRFAARYLAPGGAIYGTNSHGWKNAFFRPPNRSPHVRGLYFVGGSSHPGGGTPTVLISAEITSAMMVADARP